MVGANLPHFASSGLALARTERACTGVPTVGNGAGERGVPAGTPRATNEAEVQMRCIRLTARVTKNETFEATYRASPSQPSARHVGTQECLLSLRGTPCLRRCLVHMRRQSSPPHAIWPRVFASRGSRRHNLNDQVAQCAWEWPPARQGCTPPQGGCDFCEIPRQKTRPRPTLCKERERGSPGRRQSLCCIKTCTQPNVRHISHAYTTNVRLTLSRTYSMCAKPMHGMAT